MNYSHLISFAAGVAVTLFAWDYSSRGDTIKQQNTVIVSAEAQAKRVEKDVQENSVNVQEYLDAISAANRVIDDTAISLRVCKADSLRAGVSASNSAAAEEQARADNAKLRQDILQLRQEAVILDAWTGSCYGFVNASRDK